MNHDHPPVPDDEKSIWEKPGTILVLWIVLIAGCVLSAAGGFVLSAQHKIHGHFGFDEFAVFYGVLGFVAFSFIVLAGQHLRKILMRDEDYYERIDPDAPKTDASSHDKGEHS